MKKSIISTLLIFAVLAFLVSCGGSEGSGSGGSGNNDSGETGSIYGVVTDKALGESIINAGVELQPVGLKTVTGSDGQFEFNEVAVGTYTLYVTKTGYSDNSSSITVESGKQSKGDVQLEKLPAALRIVDDNGKDISELDFGEKLADVSRQFNIFNDGYEKLEWELSFSADWIKSVSKESGELKAGGTQGVIVNIDRSLLESGENVTTIHVTSNDGNKQLTVKATNATVLPTLNTLETTNITSSTAVLNAEILTKGVPSYSERGFVYALTSNPTLEDKLGQLTAKVTEENLYSATVTGLELGETYYVRGYAINEAGVAYSTNVVSFKPHQSLPELTTEHPTNISFGSGTATFNGTIVSIGDPAYTERGFVYGHDHNPTVEDDNKKEVTGNGDGAFSIKVTELVINTIYYIRAYAINEAGIGYGNEIMLEFNAIKPIVYTQETTNINIGAGIATFNGSIESVGDPAYTERGFVYGFTHNPTIEDDTKKAVSGTGTGAFSATVTELEMNKTYYVRAYAANTVGTFYGDEIVLNFNAVMPVVNTSAVTARNIGGGTATFNGAIVSVGDPEYTERGFVYALTHSPTIDDTKKVASGNGTGTFSANITELEMNKTYYVRAYATNAVGTFYGDEVVLNFNAEMPVVNTNAVTAINIGGGSATFNGTITSIGDPEYKERGFVYALTHSPTIDDTKKVISGSGTGAFSANITGLSMNKIYYIRAYATSDAGMVYGSEVSADFSAIMPVVTTSAATSINIAGGTATLNGSITSVGDPAYTERGFVYGTVHNPTVEDDTKKIASGSGTGDFSANVTDLVLNTTYYIRAYAKNANGVSYGDEVSLNFQGTIPIVNTNAVTEISIAGGTATFNGSIESVGDPEYSEHGFVYALTHNPNIVDDTKKVASGSGTGAFSASVTNLEMNKIYYVRAYATNLQGTAYGDEVTLDFSQVFPVVTTLAVSDIYGTTATFNGTIESIGDPAYTERGFVYGKMPVPTLDEDGVLTLSASGTSTGVYSRSVSNLEIGTTYYIRAYAKIDAIFIYGEIFNFTVPPYVELPNGILVTLKDASVNTMTRSDAESICSNSTLGGLVGWQIPNLDVLMTIYINKDSIGNFKAANYWSSTHRASSNNWFVVNFSSGTQGELEGVWGDDKAYVRCIRYAN